MTKVNIKPEWQPVGKVRLRDGLRFPALDPIPGAYRIAVGSEVYVGEADNLVEPLHHMATPDERIITVIRSGRVLVLRLV